MTEDKLAPIVGEIVLEVGHHRAWEVLTAPRHVTRWLGCMNYTGKLGSTFYMQQDPAKREAGDITGATHCEILALDEPFTFRFSWFIPGTPATEVEITLAKITRSSTKVTLTHSGWDKFKASDVRMFWDTLSGGWKSFVLPSLKHEADNSR